MNCARDAIWLAAVIANLIVGAWQSLTIAAWLLGMARSPRGFVLDGHGAIVLAIAATPVLAVVALLLTGYPSSRTAQSN